MSSRRAAARLEHVQRHPAGDGGEPGAQAHARRTRPCGSAAARSPAPRRRRRSTSRASGTRRRAGARRCASNSSGKRIGVGHLVTFLSPERSPSMAAPCGSGPTAEDTQRGKRASDVEARMKNPAAVLPGAWQAVVALNKASDSGGVPADTMEIVHLRVSQVNGCSACVASAAKSAQSPERMATVAAWRESPYFTDAERAALALAEAATRLADSPDPVPGRDLGRGGQALRRAGPGRPGPQDRRHQRLQPPQPRHPPAGRLGIRSPRRSDGLRTDPVQHVTA